MSSCHHSHAPSLPPYLTPPRHGPHRALFMPDILQSILKYIVKPSLDDLTSQRLSSNRESLPVWVPLLLVCHDWHRIAQNVIFRWATLVPDQLSFNCPARFPHPLLHVVRLQLVASANRSWMPSQNHVDLLLAQLGHSLSMSSSPANSQLRELSMRNLSPIFYLPQILSIAPLRTQLTALELSFACTTSLPIHLLLSSVDAPGLASTPLPNLRHLLIHGAELLPLPEGIIHDSTNNLTALRLDHVCAQIGTFQSLLLGVAGPALKQLVLRVWNTPIEDIFTTVFLDTWAPLCSGLDWFETSELDHPNVLMLHSLNGRVPQTQLFKWLWVPRVTDARFIMDFRMLILDISGDWIYGEWISPLIHQFLCSEGARTLREVVIPAIPFNTAIFDPTWSDADKISSQPWTCTSLQKLVVTFTLPQYTEEEICLYTVCCTSAQYSKASRLACGFIITSCPELFTLDITFRGKAFDLDPEGGLCFLGRLRRLKHLVWGQTHGVTQSFPLFYFNGDRRNPWPYDVNRKRVLAQQQTIAVPSYSNSGTKELSLPVLRWMSTEPTDEDRKRKWTNIARCRHLYRLDNDISQTAKLTIQKRRRKARSGWQSMLKAILTNKNAREGACWNRLQTFICRFKPHDVESTVPHHKESGAFCNAFIRCYSEELQIVLPHIEIKFSEGQWSLYD